MIKKYLLTPLLIIFFAIDLFAQGFGIPTKKIGLGFGNLPTFTGIRINPIDKNIDRIVGINITAWQPGSFDVQTGSFYGLGLGIPTAMGTKNRYGVSFAVFGVGATETIAGVNIAGLAAGGNNAFGINIGGLAAGAGENLYGLNFGGLAAGAGKNAAGVNIGGLGIGAGENVAGLNIGGLGVGAGQSVSGISVGALGVGAGEKVIGITIGGLGVGAGEKLVGLNIGGLGVGAGEKVIGLNFSALAIGSGGVVAGFNLAGLAVGAPEVKGISTALIVGGSEVTGLSIAPAYFRIKQIDGEGTPTMTGVSVSAFNHIQGVQKGLTIGIFNYAHRVKGVQIGLLNYNRSNPKGLRWLPIFNAGFGG